MVDKKVLRLLAFCVLELILGPGAIAAAESCIDCHKKSGPSLVAAWEASRHASQGVGCAECHGEDHSTIFAVKGRVSAGICGKCHSKQEREFRSSLHAVAVDTMIADPKFARLSPIMAEMACNSCHQIGARFPDGSRGSCNSCHSGHSFSVAEARQPAACASCHSGPDHAQMEMWTASKHGQLFAAEETRNQAPTCVTCHMPGGTHNTGIGISFGNVANGAVLEGSKVPVKMRSISLSEAEVQRGLMIKTCLPCHSSRFATESLTKADLVKFEADGMLVEAAEIIADLKKLGLLPKSRPAKPANVPSDTGDASDAVIAEPDFEGPSQIEQRFFDLVKFHHSSTFKGAYHHSPMHTHNQGFLRLRQDLNFIQFEAAQIRKRNSESQP